MRLGRARQNPSSRLGCLSESLKLRLGKTCKALGKPDPGWIRLCVSVKPLLRLGATKLRLGLLDAASRTALGKTLIRLGLLAANPNLIRF